MDFKYVRLGGPPIRRGIRHRRGRCGSAPAAESAFCEGAVGEGSLQLFAAIAYARSGRPADAWRSWDEADEASRLLGPAHHNDLTMFGEANVGIYAVAIDIETGKASSGLSRARKVDDAAIPSTNRHAQHKLDVARGHWTRGDHDGVLAALCDSEHESTETIFYSPVARELVLGLLNASRRKPDPRLLALGKRIRVL